CARRNGYSAYGSNRFDVW
nr:immunoglobulin heavy chain junction region [Macaca mulatta]MOX94740.1 immunoglobulin heavy chain junction region [Macaca mulatta]MOX94931.1 immunoglobulin heavy chain junction region [Macaca mulatta]MOX95635.1 immunoglobulin heavy chain junction region [Macaca mulatta]MOX95809.1 immunoglobulin heavy chain junction region [Macaca mulatta]